MAALVVAVFVMLRCVLAVIEIIVGWLNISRGMGLAVIVGGIGYPVIVGISDYPVIVGAVINLDC